MIRADVQPSGFRTHASGLVHGWQSVSEANDLEEKRREPENKLLMRRGVARALICFHTLMLRDFVALAESGDGRERATPTSAPCRGVWLFTVKSLGVDPGHVAPL